jgi:hypothetical protein
MEMSTHDPIIIIIIIIIIQLLIMEEPDQPAAHTHRVDCSLSLIEPGVMSKQKQTTRVFNNLDPS